MTFERFFDDAAVFPPGSAALPDAVREHLARRGTDLGRLVGPLLLTPERVHDAATLAAGATAATVEPLLVGIVVAPSGLGDAAALAADPPDGVVVSGLELKTDDRWREQVAAATALAGPYAVHVELPAQAVREGALDLLAGTPVRLKFRTGGLEAALFPSSVELADVITGAAAAGVPFKLTAGLHRAVRHTDPATGFTHHGFVNIAVATAAARDGAGRDDVAALLALTDPAVVRREYDALAAGGDWRAGFESFGTCSIVEPVESLVALGLLPSLFGDLR